jgi:integrase
MANHSKPIQDRLIRQYLVEAELPKSTYSVAKAALNRWAIFLASLDRPVNLLEATRSDFVEWKALLKVTIAKGKQECLSPPTINSYLNRVRAFYRWAEEVELLEGRNPTLTVRGLKVDGESEDQPVMTDDIFHTLLATARQNRSKHNARRDVAILTVLWETGLRRIEICNLNLDQYRPSGQAAHLVVGSARRTTKSMKVRYPVLTRVAVRAIEAYLSHRGEDAGPLFLSTSSHDGRLNPMAITQMVERVRVRAGLDDRQGIHSLRRAYAINAKREGVSDGALKAQCGWEDQRMIGRYTKSAEVELAHAEILAKLDKKTLKPVRPMPQRYKKAS